MFPAKIIHSSGLGIKSDSKQKRGEALMMVSVNNGKSNQVIEPRSPTSLEVG